MKWNLENIRFLHPPDDFMGSFSNEKMQARHEALQKQKISELTSALEAEQDPYEAMKILHKKEHLKFLLANIDLFKEADRFEKGVLYLFFRENTPFAASGQYEVWESLFRQCDREKMKKLGKPLPISPVKAYRGSVTGVKKGFSWTIDPKEASWILESWGDPEYGGGTVFELVITVDDILMYREDDRRREIILRPELVESAEPKAIQAIEKK